MSTHYVCGHARRLQAVKLAGVLNGIDHLEVRHTDEPVVALKQRTLLVRLLDPVPAGLDAASVAIDGGERVRRVAVTWAVAATGLAAVVTAAEAAALLDGLEEPDHVLVVRTEERGDFSRYRLALVAGAGSDAPPAGFDPLLAEVAFSFKVECPSDFDCAPRCTCPPGVHHAPPIDYLAKDYQGFRRLMLERMSLLAPGWTERLPADVGVTLVELLAYVADELSYRQDAVATEAYLDTARSRVSLRRHARLVDYRMHDGANAHAWVQVRVDSPTVVLPAGTQVLSRVPGLPPSFAAGSTEHEAAVAAGSVVFETVEEAVLHHDLDVLRFWTWGEQGCVLPAGATSATLRGHHPLLRAGAVLALVETESPTVSRTAAQIAADGDESPDADPRRRVAVRLTEVVSGTDPSGLLFPGGTADVTEIRWHERDALPFPLCLSVADGDREIAVAWGNLVPADHGATVADEDLGTVPAPTLTRVPDDPCAEGSSGDALDDPRLVVPVRFRPTLARRPLTHAVARPQAVLGEVPLTAALQAELDGAVSADLVESVFAGLGLVVPDGSPVRGTSPLWSVSAGGAAWLLRSRAGALQVLSEADPASVCALVRPREALPALRLSSDLAGVTDPWLPRPDLLASGPLARELTAEVEHDGEVRLRFGDGEHGLRPATGTAFSATYRVGNGTAGNVGRNALAHLVTGVGGITQVRNPLPAAGGAEPETGDEVRRDAPQAFSVQERAVTEPDYAAVAERHEGVQRAAATFRWTGSWHTAFVTADRFGGRPVDAPFERDLRGFLERFRMAGYDLEVDAPVFVPIALGLHVCVLPGHFRSPVAVDVRDALSAHTLPDGRLGLFHPDHLTFGGAVHLSAVLAAVHAVPGVQSVQVTTFERLRVPASSGLTTGVLPMGRLEIPRLDDDPSFPERGVLDLTFGGGT